MCHWNDFARRAKSSRCLLLLEDIPFFAFVFRHVFHTDVFVSACLRMMAVYVRIIASQNLCFGLYFFVSPSSMHSLHESLIIFFCVVCALLHCTMMIPHETRACKRIMVELTLQPPGVGHHLLSCRSFSLNKCRDVRIIHPYGQQVNDYYWCFFSMFVEIYDIFEEEEKKNLRKMGELLSRRGQAVSRSIQDWLYRFLYKSSAECCFRIFLAEKKEREILH